MKSVYERLEYELLKPYILGSGLGNKFNRLIKLQLETEDDVLIKGIDNIMEHLKEANRLRTIRMYGKSSKEAEIASELMSRLATYCSVQRETCEPEWMIIARKNNWEPVSSKEDNMNKSAIQESDFEKVLNDALNSVTLFEVTRQGKLLASDRTDYLEKYHDADSEGGIWKRAEIWEYQGKNYIVVYKCCDFPMKRETCIVFREYSKEG